MIDVNIIKRQYAGMPDEELLELLREGDSLTREAYLALKQECRKRNIEPEVLAETDSALIEGRKQKIRNSFENERQKFIAGIWDYVFSQKHAGAPDTDLKMGLMIRQLTEEEADYVLESLPEKARLFYNDADSDVTGAFIRMLCGVAVIVIAWLATLGKGVFAFGGLVMAFSIVNIATASARRSRFKTILANLHPVVDKEEEPQ